MGLYKRGLQNSSLEKKQDESQKQIIPKTVEECCEDYLSYLDVIKGYSKNTLTGYGDDFNHFKLIFGKDTLISAITAEQLKESIGSFSKRKYKGTSINRYIAAVRGLFAYCKKFQYISSNVALELKTVKTSSYTPAFMSGEEIDSLCRLPDESNILWASRDKAIFEMFYSSGCRVSELASLKFSDFTENFSSAIVTGKGSKDRRVFFEKDAVAALKQYLEERKARFPECEKNQSAEVDEIFLNQKGKALTVNGIQYVVSRYTKLKEFSKHVSPHAFRHTFATSMLSEGADVRVVQEMLGHSSISTTQRYTHISREHLKEVYEQAHPHSGSKE